MGGDEVGNWGGGGDGVQWGAGVAMGVQGGPADLGEALQAVCPDSSLKPAVLGGENRPGRAGLTPRPSRSVLRAPPAITGFRSSLGPPSISRCGPHTRLL